MEEKASFYRVYPASRATFCGLTGGRRPGSCCGGGGPVPWVGSGGPVPRIGSGVPGGCWISGSEISGIPLVGVGEVWGQSGSCGEGEEEEKGPLHSNHCYWCAL